MKIITLALLAALGFVGAQQPADQTKERITEAEKLMRSGDVAGAVTLLQTMVKGAPQSAEAHLALGRALDLNGDHKTARRHLEQAISLATDSNRNQALSAMGVSWAFESKPDEAARYYQRIFDAQTQAKDRGGAAGTANALGRIYLESGSLDRAEQWYRTGHETAKQIPELPENQIALWEMRWHNAQGRIAARKKNASGAAEHAAQAKSSLDKSGNKNQQAFHPYLLGYIAFYGGHYKQAIDELLLGDQQDPFILGLIAQAYEKLGDRAKAREFYEKVMALPVHSINTAFARPRARAYLARRR